MATSPDDTTDDEDRTGYDEIPPHIREKALKRDNYTCQLGGERGLRVGGDLPTEVHHIEDDPDDCDRHDMENLITLCIHCHYWHHSRPDSELPDADITTEAAAMLKPVDFEIIDLLYREGPLSIESIDEGTRPSKCRNSLKERLWRTMGIDTVVDDQQQLIDQDSNTGLWGAPHHIESSERRVPTTVDGIVRRTIDSLVVAARERGCDKEMISEVIDITERTIDRNSHRGQAYDFPLEEFTGRGRPPKNGGGRVEQSQTDGGVPESQQHLDELSGDGDTVATDTDNNTDNNNTDNNNTDNNNTDTDIDNGDA